VPEAPPRVLALPGIDVGHFVAGRAMRVNGASPRSDRSRKTRSEGTTALASGGGAGQGWLRRSRSCAPIPACIPVGNPRQGMPAETGSRRAIPRPARQRANGERKGVYRSSDETMPDAGRAHPASADAPELGDVEPLGFSSTKDYASLRTSDDFVGVGRLSFGWAIEMHVQRRSSRSSLTAS